MPLAPGSSAVRNGAPELIDEAAERLWTHPGPAERFDQVPRRQSTTSPGGASGGVAKFRAPSSPSVVASRRTAMLADHIPALKTLSAASFRIADDAPSARPAASFCCSATTDSSNGSDDVALEDAAGQHSGTSRRVLPRTLSPDASAVCIGSRS